MANPLVHLKDCVLSFIRKKAWRLRGPPVKTSHITIISPYLVEACRALILEQGEDGSWENDPLTTSFVVDVLYRAFNIGLKCSGMKRAIVKGVKYLRCKLRELSEKIIRSKNLYPGLDRNSRTLFQIIQTLSILGDTTVSEENVRKAFKRTLSALSQYCFTLDSPQAVSSALIAVLCLGIPFEEKLVQGLLDYVIVSLFAEKTQSQHILMLAHPLVLWSRTRDDLIISVHRRHSPSEQVNINSILNKTKSRVHAAIKNLFSKPFVDVELLVYAADLLNLDELKDDALFDLIRERIIEKAQELKLNASSFNYKAPAGLLALLCHAIMSSKLDVWNVFPEDQLKKLHYFLSKCMKYLRFKKEKERLKWSVVALLFTVDGLLLAIISHVVAQSLFIIIAPVITAIISFFAGIVMSKY